MQRRIRLLSDGFAHDPPLDTAVSRALLLRASDGEVPETLRLHSPGRVVAFGKRDTLEPGYAAAIGATHEAGFTPIERIAGGRAAVFTEETIAFAWTVPDTDPRRGIYERFETLSAIMVRAFASLGVVSSVGGIPGEYCPGDYSVHHAGTIKLMGVGQRLAKAAAHVGGVVVVRKSALIRTVLLPVYAALGLEWEPTTAGALSDVAPEVEWGHTVEAIRREFAHLAELEPASLADETISLARKLAPEHVPAVVAAERG